MKFYFFPYNDFLQSFLEMKNIKFFPKIFLLVLGGLSTGWVCAHGGAKRLQV